MSGQGSLGYSGENAISSTLPAVGRILDGPQGSMLYRIPSLSVRGTYKYGGITIL